MKTLYLPEIDELNGAESLDEAREFLEKNRLYNVKETDQGFTAYVLPPRKPLPLEVGFRPSQGKIDWECECGATAPCAHWWALILKLDRDGLLPREESVSRLRTRLSPEEAEGQMEETEENRGGSEQPDLFSGLSLFSDVDPFEEKGDDRYEPVLQIYQEETEGYLALRPMVRHIYSDRKEGNILPWKREKLTLELGEEEEKLVFALLRSPHPPAAIGYTDKLDILPLCYGTRGAPLAPMAFDNLLITFRLHNYIPDRGVVFQPRFTLRRGEECLAGPLLRKELEIEEGSLLYLKKREGELLFLPRNRESSYFIKLLLSRSGGFLEKDLIGLRKMARRLDIQSVNLDTEGLSVKVQTPEPQPILKIRTRSEKTEIFFYFRYDDQEIPAQQLENFKALQKGDKILIYQRDRDREKKRLTQLTNILEGELQYERGYYSGYLAGEETEDLRLGLSLGEFLTHYGPVLTDAGAEIQLEDRPITRGEGLNFSLTKDRDLLKVDARVTLDEEEIQIMLDRHFSELGLVRAGGRYIALDAETLERLDRLRRQGMSSQGELETTLANIPVLETLSGALEEKESDLIGENLDALRRLESVGTIEPSPLPDRLGTTLRHYQEHGYNWLRFLHRYGLGGCLADDMGLGKTVQTLALLQKLKEEGVLQTSLLITPVVTLPNWEGELKKFTPEINYLCHSGRNRAEHADYFEGLDLIIVSYQTVRYDIDLFLDREYDYVILDEGHYIKNASSQTFRAIKRLRSRHRLSLTGTPIENNTSELWSQMTFLNPGLLGTMGEFQERFAIPIEKQHDEDAAFLLRKTVFPFILRRKKEEVATDLPPREEILHYLDMSGPQAEVYERQKEFYRALVDGLIEREGLQKASIEIFSYILKMRRLAIHPPMVGEEYRDTPSCKMEALVNLLEKLQGEDHKVLIFSQFLGTLESLRRLCETRHWLYAHITGETEDRKEEIDRFQHNPEVRIFLLSLKAGGIGINLTAADYVVLFDPWWNPAVERQAVDRAYRIGQKRKVITYKFITRNTIEEKILAMQEEKKDLADKIITEDQGFVKQLTGREILNLFS